MAERCELCGARWEIGASTCRDCGSKRRITVQPGESSASMPGLAFVREALAQGTVPIASDSTSGVVMVRVDASSAPFVAADVAAREAPVARASVPSAPVPAAPPPASGTRPSSVTTLPPTPLVHTPASAATSPSAPSSGTSLASGAVQAVLPPGFSQPLGRPAGRRTLWLLGAAVIVGAGIGVTLWLTAPPADPSDAALAPVEVRVGQGSPAAGCEQLAELAGTWVFTTATTGARRKERLGVRGFYQLQITVDGCTATASMAKTGRTDRTAFDGRKVPRAEAPLAPGEGMEAYGFAGTFVLRNEDGQGVDTRFVLARDGERLVGHWRQLGERWASSGLYGVLEGRREGDPVAILPERSNQPCAVRCATPDDIARLDAPDPATHAACLAACE